MKYFTWNHYFEINFWNQCIAFALKKLLHRKSNSHIFWHSWRFCDFCNIICYIYHQTKCDTTREVVQEVGEIEPWQCFSYFVSWRVNSKISLQNIRTIIVNGYSDWFGFLKVRATRLNEWQVITIKHNTSIKTRQVKIQLNCLSSVSTKIMYWENMTPLIMFYQTPSQSNDNICIELINDSVTSVQNEKSVEVCCLYCNKVYKSEAKDLSKC